MTTVSELTSKNIASAQANVQTWGSIIINVKVYGAKGNANYYNSGDGLWYQDSAYTIQAQDDRQAIQNAVDSVSKGTIFFPKGNYLIKGKNVPMDNNSRLVDGVWIKSDITLEGNKAKLIADVNCNHIIDTALRVAITDPTNNLKNITIRDLAFEKPNKTWTEQSHLVNIENVTNLLIENCVFKGWSGDALNLGWLLAPDTGSWLQTYIQDVRILNCNFDGVGKDNRQGISIHTGENVLIENCSFTRTSRTDMPGAIDVEPEKDWCIVDNIKVKNCTFIDIGGNVGVVTFALGWPTTARAENLYIEDCYFSSVTNPFSIGIRGRPSADPLLIDPNSPRNINITRNTFEDGIRWFNVGGAEDVTLRDNTVNNFTIESLIGGLFSGGMYYPLSGFNLIRNTVKDYKTEAAANIGIMRTYANVLSGVIADNTFIDCGNTAGGVPQTFLVLVMGDEGVNSKNLIIKNNDFLNTAFSSTSHVMAASTLVNPSLIIAKNNTFINCDIYSNANSLYKQCRVEGAEGIVADSQSTGSANIGFNLASIFTESTLPDSFKTGLSISMMETGAILINVKARTRLDQRQYNFQIKFATTTQANMFVRYPLTGSNVWGSWVTFTGV